MSPSAITVSLGAAAIGMMLLSAPRRASAQEHEVELDSLGQEVQLDEALGQNLEQFSVTGFGVGLFDYRHGVDQNTLGATKLAVALYKRAGPHLSFFGQLTTAFEIPGLGGEDDEGDGEVAPETEIDNLIVSFTPPGAPELTLWLGRFDAPLGFERDDEPLNFQPTPSFNFEFARPVKFTGLLAQYTPLPELSMAGFVVNGWDQPLDENKGKTIGARVSVLPFEYTGISFTGVYGPEQPDDTHDKRLFLGSDFTAQPIRELIVGGELNYGREDDAAIGDGDGKWVGGLVTGFLRFAPNLGLTLRYDIFDDRDGARTGAPRTLQSFTVAPMLFFRSAVTGIFSTIPQTGFRIPEFTLRAGIRRDRSTDPFFETETGLSRWETRLVVEGVYVY